VIIDPNIVSGADLDARGYYSFVSDTAIVKLEEEKAILNQKMDSLKSKIDQLTKKAGDAMSYLQSSSRDADILKSKIAGTYGRSVYDAASVAQFTHELEGIKAEQKIKTDIWESANREISSTQYEQRNIGVKINEIDNEISILNKHTTTDPVTNNDSTVYDSGSDISSDPVVDLMVETQPVEPIGLVSQIGAKFGLSKNQTYMAFGAVAILGVVLITKK